jgi:hypothetical protein
MGTPELRFKISGQSGSGASEWRRLGRQAAAPPDKESIIDFTLPSGFVVKLTRPPLDMWLLNGAIPTQLIDKALAAFSEAGDDDAGRREAVAEVLQENPSQALRTLAFMRSAVERAVVWPRITLDADPNNPDEMHPGDIPEGDFAAIVGWVLGGSKGVPVETTGGGTTVEAVENFPAKPRVRGSRKSVSKARRTSKRKGRRD